MKNVTLMMTVAAALVLGLSSAKEARAWFGGGSSGSCGSHGGFFSGGSHGSSGGSFGGLFGRHGSNGSCGSSGGSYSGDCGCGGNNEDSDAHGDNDHKSMNPPAAPRDPGSATQAPAGGGAAVIEPTPAIKGERVVVMATGSPRPMRVLNR